MFFGEVRESNVSTTTIIGTSRLLSICKPRRLSYSRCPHENLHHFPQPCTSRWRRRKRFKLSNSNQFGQECYVPSTRDSGHSAHSLLTISCFHCGCRFSFVHRFVPVNQCSFLLCRENNAITEASSSWSLQGCVKKRRLLCLLQFSLPPIDMQRESLLFWFQLFGNPTVSELSLLICWSSIDESLLQLQQCITEYPSS